jgi:hypothetical protein
VGDEALGEVVKEDVDEILDDVLNGVVDEELDDVEELLLLEQSPKAGWHPVPQYISPTAHQPH